MNHTATIHAFIASSCTAHVFLSVMMTSRFRVSKGGSMGCRGHRINSGPSNDRS